jgi:hypothetical protein
MRLNKNNSSATAVLAVSLWVGVLLACNLSN